MQVVNFISVPSVETKVIVLELFNVIQQRLKLFCYDNDSVCEIRENSLIITKPAGDYFPISRSSLYSLLRVGFDIVQTEPFSTIGTLALSVRFDFKKIPRNVKTSIYKKNFSLVFGKGLQEILVDKFLWINRFRENQNSL